MKNGRTAARVAAAMLAAAMAMTSTFPAHAAGNLTVETAEQGARNGVSKVIGLRGSVNSYSMGTGAYEKQYSYAINTDDTKYVSGTKETMKFGDSLYKNGNDYYTEAEQVSPSIVKLSDKVVVLPQAAAAPTEDPATGLYAVGGKYYSSYSSTEIEDGKDEYGYTKWKTLAYYVRESNEAVNIGTVPGEFSSSYYSDYDGYNDLSNAVNAAFGRKVNTANTDYDYFEANGKQYKSIDVKTAYVDATGKYTVKCVYARKNSEISFANKYQRISWNEVTNQTEVDSNGKFLKVGYQVRAADKDVPLEYVAANGSALQTFTTDTTYTSADSCPSTAKVKYEVRAVYYTETENYTSQVDTETGKPYESNAGTSYAIVKTGAWSDPFTYAWSIPSVPAVGGLKVQVKKAGMAELSWNPVKNAYGYSIEYTSSPVPLTDFSNAEWSTTTTEGETNTHYEISTQDFGTSYDSTQKIDMENKYRYYRVCAYVGVGEDSELVNYGGYSNVVAASLDKRSNTPAIKGLKVEKKDDGSFNLAWNSIDEDAEVYIFASKDQKMFNSMEYAYRYLDIEGKDAEGKTYRLGAVSDGHYDDDDDTWHSYYAVTSLKDKFQTINKKVKSAHMGKGIDSVPSSYLVSNLGLEVGEKYYFVVATIDSANHGTDRSAATPYVANVAKAAGANNTVRFGFYNDIAASGKVSATAGIYAEEPSTTSGKQSITMNFGKGSHVTGFEISRKNSKGKFKKIATINSNQYIDEGLKENTVYDYQVRAYYYNPDTKKSAYSAYVYFSAETSSSAYLELKAEKQSKNAVKLKWTKVPGATQYDIYRSYTSSENTSYSPQKNGFGDGRYTIRNAKWEKVKTISKAKTVTYTDKKLKKGTNYNYRVVATYASGKTKKQVYAMASVTMKMAAPQNLKLSISKNTLKATWDKDTFASKYEVKYKKYDAEGRPEKNTWTTKTTKKNSYTIKNIAKGGRAVLRVRAYGDKKWSTYSESQITNGELAAAKGISAKEATETGANGKKASVVKISWKKVPEAAYYVVHRSTSPAVYYNQDKKVYDRPDDMDWALVAKECNTDESLSLATVPYREYKGEEGTILSTKTVDRARLQTGVTYYYYVDAYSADGKRVSAGYSKPASLCYKASTAAIKKISAKKGKVTLKLAKVSKAKQYVVYRSNKKNAGFAKIGTTKTTTYVDKTVQKGKTYYYKVVAVGAGANGLKGDLVTNASPVKSIKAK